MLDYHTVPSEGRGGIIEKRAQVTNSTAFRS